MNLPQTFACPACGKRFTWKPQFARRKMQCACGRTFVPTVGLEALRPQGEVYNINLARAEEVSTVEKAVVKSVVKAYPRRKRIEIIEEEIWADEPFSPVKDRYLPLILMVVGLIGRLLLMFATHVSGQSAFVDVVLVLFELIIYTAIMLFGVYLTAMFLGASFGNLARVALKLAGMAIFAAALAGWIASIDHDPYSIRGRYVGMLMVLLVYFGLFYSLFDLDLQESLITTVFVGVLQGLIVVGMHSL